MAEGGCSSSGDGGGRDDPSDHESNPYFFQKFIKSKSKKVEDDKTRASKESAVPCKFLKFILTLVRDNIIYDFFLFPLFVCLSPLVIL